MITKKDLNYYLNLDWSYSIDTERSKGLRYYIIRVNELPGVCTDATTIEQGMEDIKEAIAGAIELYLEHGESVPEPIDKNRFKGKILYRTDSSRHYELAKLAKREHKSLNKTLDMVVDAGMQQIGI